MSSKTRPPGETLAFEPKIASEADLCSAMAELAWIDTRQAELEAECDRQVEAIKTRYQGLMRLVVEGRWDVSFADRQAVLSQAIEAYCNEHQGELVKGKGRSREFTHGTVSWKKTPEGVKVAEGRKADDLTEEFIDQHELRPRLHELLESISVCGEPGSKEHRSAADFFDIA
ncbi:MAG: host-nuclease inhibitor Gam family protein, partial [Burkholderiaceae bacterium]|nr:host-nuclease inhibitor Gam family protein [Burkholderiaceae bacterium]